MSPSNENEPRFQEINSAEAERIKESKKGIEKIIKPAQMYSDLMEEYKASLSRQIQVDEAKQKQIEKFNEMMERSNKNLENMATTLGVLVQYFVERNNKH